MKTRVEIEISDEARLIVSVLAANAGKTNVDFLTEMCQNSLDALISSFDNSKMDEIANVMKLLRFRPEVIS